MQLWLLGLPRLPWLSRLLVWRVLVRLHELLRLQLQLLVRLPRLLELPRLLDLLGLPRLLELPLRRRSRPPGSCLSAAGAEAG